MKFKVNDKVEIPCVHVRHGIVIEIDESSDYHQYRVKDTNTGRNYWCDEDSLKKE